MKGKKAITDVERNRQVRAKKVAEGQRQYNIWLTPAAQLALNETKDRLESRGVKKTYSEIVCDALTDS